MLVCARVYKIVSGQLPVLKTNQEQQKGPTTHGPAITQHSPTAESEVPTIRLFHLYFCVYSS